MATWVDPIDSQTDPDAPLTADLGKRWDNNIIAFYEQGSASPIDRTRVHPFDRTTVGGTENGQVWDYSVDGGGSFETGVLDGAYSYSLRLFDVRRSAAVADLLVDFLDSGGSVIDTVNLGALDTSSGLDANTSVFAGNYYGDNADPDVSDTPVDKIRVRASGGTFVDGRAYLYKNLGGLR